MAFMVIDASTLNGANGFTIHGFDGGDQFGFSVASAGDFNDDGIPDVIIGAPFEDGVGPFLDFDHGAAYVVFGKDTNIGPYDPNFFVSSLGAFTAGPNAGDGFYLFGPNAGDRLGFSVASAGDFNGDDIADVVIGRPGADGVGPLNFDAGGFVVLFGGAGNDSTGRFWEVVAQDSGGDSLGAAVASAGDFNGDGLDDIIISAPFDDLDGSDVGFSGVIFGHTPTGGIIGPDVAITFQTFSWGEAFNNSGSSEMWGGYSVATVGDINLDGYTDVIIGAPRTDAPSEQTQTGGGFGGISIDNAGVSWLVFGGPSGGVLTLPANESYWTPGSSPSRYKAWVGEDSFDLSGFSVASAGDINGDGAPDFVIGAPLADGSGFDNGAAYVVFGPQTGLNVPGFLPGGVTPFGVVSLLGNTYGFKISGASAFDNAGWQVAPAGDVNGDGVGDLIVGAPGLDGSFGVDYGAAYVVYGKNTSVSGPFAANIDLATLDDTQGFIILGTEPDDKLGYSVASAGDMNGDGRADLIIGAPGAQGTGLAYVVFGPDPTGSVGRTGSPLSQTLAGGNFDDTLTGLGGNDFLYGNGGTDTAIYSGNRADYTVSQNADGSIVVTDTRPGSPDGTDTVYDTELFQFADRTQTTAQLLNLPPSITSNGGGNTASVSIAENTRAVTTVAATDPEGDTTLSYSIVSADDGGAADWSKFSINAATGALAFFLAPDYEIPTDANTDHVYEVTVQVADDLGGIDTQTIAVTVTNTGATLVGDTSGSLTGKQTGKTHVLSGTASQDNTIYGDAVGNLTDKAKGGNDKLTGGGNSGDGIPTNALYGDAGGSMSGTTQGSNDFLRGGDNSGPGGLANNLYGDANGTMSDKAKGGNDYLQGGNNRGDQIVTNVLFGDVAGAMSGSTKGGNDVVIGGNNSGPGGVLNSLHGDAGSMSGSAEGGNDVLTGGNNSGGNAVSNVLVGDSGTTMSDSTKGGNDALTGGNNSGIGVVGSNLVGDAPFMSGKAKGGNDILTGANNSGSGEAFSDLYGDAAEMSGAAKGGNDKLFGGNNTGSGQVITHLYGDAQTMSGTAKGGNDVLVSGSGTDHMYGDAAVLSGSAKGGNDTFIFKDAFGTDFVYDFHQREDLIVFSGDDVNRFRDLDITMIGSDTVITVSPTDIVTLVGYDNTLHPLTAHDFLFT